MPGHGWGPTDTSPTAMQGGAGRRGGSRRVMAENRLSAALPLLFQFVALHNSPEGSP